MKSFKYVVPLLIVALIFASGSLPAFAAPQAQAGPQTWMVLAGAEADVQKVDNGQAGAWQIMAFYPSTITVNEGDTIVWKLNSTEFHTVSFLAPGQQKPGFAVPEGGNSQRLLMNSQAFYPQGEATFDGTKFTSSGLLSTDIPQTPKEYKLTFTKAGTFSYTCIVHPGMEAKVVVQPKGTAYPKTQAQVDADAKAAVAADQQAAAQAAVQAKQALPTKPGANGTTVHQVKMGVSTEMADYMRFVPQNLTIRAGDTVEWLAGNGGTPHTVTFVSGGQEPMLIQPEPQQNGPPKLVLNGQVVAPAGGKTYSGAGYFNSGFVFGVKDPTPGPKSYSLTFDRPGTYTYICVLHDNMGMEGQITVLAATASANSAAGNAAGDPGAGPVTLPVTGGTTTPWALLALGLILAGAGLLTRKSSRGALRR